MALSIQQEQQYVGHDRWKWAVWLTGNPVELDQIDHVIYILHPTFPSPVREVKNRSTKFRLDTAGWGVFLIRATVKHKNGKETSLTHYLKLGYPSEASGKA